MVPRTVQESEAQTDTLLGVVKDKAKRMTPASADATDAVPQINAISAPRSLNRSMMDREDHCVAARERNRQLKLARGRGER